MSTIRVRTSADNIVPEASERFVNTPYVREITERSLAYLDAGFPVHFAGPAGTGKTTVAFHVASMLGRPVTLIHGDDEFQGSDLVGKDTGYRRSSLVDNFIHSVVKTEEEMKTLWMDQRLTTACERGHTLIYDEFNRSRPEANNPLLTILSEGILNLPKLHATGAGYMQVHPDFRAIFTSNPAEYAGVHKAQDALMDRLITIDLSHYDQETEILITMAKSTISRPDAEIIVALVRELRGVGPDSYRPTIRAAIAIAKVLAHGGRHATPGDPFFEMICKDVLNMDTAKVTHDGQSAMTQVLNQAMKKVCP